MKTDTIIAIFAVLLSPMIAIAENSQMQAEIDHLISHIRHSNCRFIRNDTEHRSEAAVAHIMKKFNYFESKITTTEEFIEYCATKSTLSGKPYKISCPDQETVESRHWLLMELKTFRSGHKNPSKAR
jgi:hypothetical protein